MSENLLQVEYVPLDAVALNPDNPRLNEAAVPGVLASLERFGWADPIVANKRTGKIIGGNTRWKAAKERGDARVPVVWLDVDEQTATALSIALNKTGEKAQWDLPVLVPQLEGLGEIDPALLEATAFSAEDLAELQASIETGVPPPKDGEPVGGGNEWRGMPEFVQENKEAWKTVQVHFANSEDLEAFALLVEQTVTPQTRAIWFPPAPIGHYADKRYRVDDS